jgi:hypothetical protein
MLVLLHDGSVSAEMEGIVLASVVVADRGGLDVVDAVDE